MFKRALLATALLFSTTFSLPAFADYQEDLFIEIFAKAYGEAVGRATVEYLIDRFERRYGRYGQGTTWSSYRTYQYPGLFPEVSERYISASELQGLSKMALWVMRNEVYARHGRPFSNAVVRRYFVSQPWYSADPYYTVPQDDLRRLSAVEKANVALISQYEKTAGSYGTPPASNHSESYWYKNVYLKESDLAGKSAWDLLVMRNQIYARHGRRFNYKPLHNHFMQQSWYRINPSYSDRLLSPTEKRNANFILKYEQKMGYM